MPPGKRLRTLAVALLLLALLPCSHAAVDVLFGPSNFTTYGVERVLDSGVLSGSSPARFLLLPGVYSEQVFINGTAWTGMLPPLLSVLPAPPSGTGTTVTLDCMQQPHSSILVFVNPWNGSLAFSDLTFQNCTWGAAIFAYLGKQDISFTRCSFRNNRMPADGRAAAGLFVMTQGNITVDSCSFTDNEAEDIWPHAMYLVSFLGGTVVRDSVFARNKVPGSLSLVDNESPTIGLVCLEDLSLDDINSPSDPPPASTPHPANAPPTLSPPYPGGTASDRGGVACQPVAASPRCTISVTNTTFTDNVGVGALAVAALGPATGVFQARFARNVGGALLLFNMTRADVQPGSTFVNNTVPAGVYSGAAIASNETTLLTIQGTTFEGNGGPRGAIWAGRNVSMDELEMRVFNCSLNSNYISQPTDQDQRGGAMLLASLARVVIYQSSFINNSVSTGCTANCVGGAISLTVISNSVNITNSTFVNNSASSGGAIYATDVSNMLVCNSTFQGNRARLGFSANGNDGGGTMFLEDNSYLFLIQTQFIDNAAVGSPWNATYNTHWMGGAIFMASTSTIEVASCLFQGNAAYAGGAVFALAGSAVILDPQWWSVDDSRFKAVWTQAWLQLATVGGLNGTLFTHNQALIGGAIMVLQGFLVTSTPRRITPIAALASYTNTTFSNNQAVSGGAVAISSSQVMSISHALFIANSAARHSDFVRALEVALEAPGALLQEDVLSGIAPNYADLVNGACGAWTGGALCVICSWTANNGVDTSLLSVVFDGNLANFGGGLFVLPQSQCQVLVSSTADGSETLFLNNHASGGAGGAVYYEMSSSLASSNASVAFNCSQRSPDVAVNAWLSILAVVNQTVFNPSILIPCSTWVNNTAGQGAFGPLVASMPFSFNFSVGSSESLAERPVVAFSAEAFEQQANGEGAAWPTVSIGRYRSGDPFDLGLWLFDAYGQPYLPAVMPKDQLVTGFMNSQDGSIVTNQVVLVNMSLTTTTYRPWSGIRLEVIPGTRIAQALVSNWVFDMLGPQISAQVRECLPGEHRNEDGSLCERCNVGYYNVEPNNRTDCSECPRNAICNRPLPSNTPEQHGKRRGGRRLHDGSEEIKTPLSGIIVPQGGYWNSNPYSAQLIQCLDREACEMEERADKIIEYQSELIEHPDRWNQTYYNQLLCAEGYTGPRCSACLDGWGLVEAGRCNKCPPPGFNTLYFVLVRLATFLVLCFTILMARYVALEVLMPSRFTLDYGVASVRGLPQEQAMVDGKGTVDGKEALKRVGDDENVDGIPPADWQAVSQVEEHPDGPPPPLGPLATPSPSPPTLSTPGPHQGEGQEGGEEGKPTLSTPGPHDGEGQEEGAAEGRGSLAGATWGGGRRHLDTVAEGDEKLQGSFLAAPSPVRSPQAASGGHGGAALVSGGGGGGGGGGVKGGGGEGAAGWSVSAAVSSGGKGAVQGRGPIGLGLGSVMTLGGDGSAVTPVVTAASGTAAALQGKGHGWAAGQGVEGAGRQQQGQQQGQGQKQRQGKGQQEGYGQGQKQGQAQKEWQGQGKPGKELDDEDEEAFDEAYVIRENEFVEETPLEVFGRLLATIKIFIGYLQVLQIIKFIPLGIPTSFTQLIRFPETMVGMTVGNIALECSMGNQSDYPIPKPMITAIVLVVLPFMIYIIVALFLIITHCLQVWRNSHSNSRNSRNSTHTVRTWQGLQLLQQHLAASAHNTKAWASFRTFRKQSGRSKVDSADAPAASTASAGNGGSKGAGGLNLILNLSSKGGDGVSLPRAASWAPAQQGAVLSIGRMLLISFITTIFFYYENEVEIILKMFHCDVVDLDTSDIPVTTRDSGLYFKSRWQHDMRTVCYEGSHAVLIWAVGIPGMVLICIGCPIWVTWFLAHNRHRLEEPDFLATYGFLYQEYVPAFYAYEALLMVRKLLISAVLVFLDLSIISRGIQLLTALALLAISIIIHLVGRPFENRRLDHLEQLNLYTLIITYFIAVWFTPGLTSVPPPSGYRAFGLFIMVLNCITIAIFVWNIFILFQAALLAKVGIREQERLRSVGARFRRTLERRLIKLTRRRWLALPSCYLILALHWLRVAGGDAYSVTIQTLKCGGHNLMVG